MLFVTTQFLIYFLIVLVVYWALPPRFRVIFLTIASMYFYATWNLTFALHFLVVVGVNWTGMELWRIYQKKWIFVLLQTANLCNLAFFKYFYFFADVIGTVAGIPELRQPNLFDSHRMMGHEILLPLAISFYTFQIMSYGFDIYRGTYAGRHSLLEVLLFKAFFPQLIAGPIMRSHELLPQIHAAAQEPGLSLDGESFYKGVWLVVIGVTKKVLIADRLSEYLGSMMQMEPSTLHPVYIWISVVGYAALIYSDFSAYSDLARGFGLLLGFQIPLNFKAPLFFVSITDFWKRWHMTLSLWLRDYIYITLGGSRVSRPRLYMNLVITFFLGGLWHGAAYTYVMWGVLMGVLLSFEHFQDSIGIPESPNVWWQRWIRRIWSHLIFWPASIFFMAPTWKWAMSALSTMLNPVKWISEGAEPMHLELFLYCMIGTLGFHLLDEYPNRFRFLRKYETVLLPVASIVVILALTQFSGGQKDFFYFQF